MCGTKSSPPVLVRVTLACAVLPTLACPKSIAVVEMTRSVSTPPPLVGGGCVGGSVGGFVGGSVGASVGANVGESVGAAVVAGSGVRHRRRVSPGPHGRRVPAGPVLAIAAEVAVAPAG